MKRVGINLCMAVGLLFFLSATADAKWWIFGKSEAPVGIEYLYINQISFEQSDQQILLFREFLTSGMVDIRGKARASAGTVGAVKVSLDGRRTWQDAKLSSGGNFEFQFRPEQGQTYDFYLQVIDTMGKTNNVEETHKVIQLTDRNIRGMIKEILDEMAAAYMAENPIAFMRYVSDQFAGDELNLEHAIRRDFNLFDNINLTLNINNLAIGSRGNIHVVIYFTRFLVSTRTGMPLRDSGLTDFVFVQQDGRPQLYSMKIPLIFGVSDPRNVATGTVRSPQNGETLFVNDQGEGSVRPFDEVLEEIEGDDDAGGGPGGGPGGEPGGGSGIPAPTQLRIVDSLSGATPTPFVALEFDSPIDPSSSQAMGYGVIVEQSQGPAGPWQEVDRREAAAFDTLIYYYIDGPRTVLYFRVRIVHLSSGQLSQPSNVIVFNNSIN